MPVACHAHGAEGMKRAIRAGVQTIEHGTYLDDEAMDLMKRNGTWLVPTLSAGLFVAEKAKVDGDRKVAEADLGPVRYLATLLGAGDQDVLRWFILVVACLLDPAAVLLLLAATRR